jgi:hypothetical protein
MNGGRRKRGGFWQRWSARLAIGVIAIALLAYKFWQVYAVLGRRHH